MTIKTLNPHKGSLLIKRAALKGTRASSWGSGAYVEFRRSPNSERFNTMDETGYSMLVASVKRSGFRHKDIIVTLEKGGDDKTVWPVVEDGWHRLSAAANLQGKHPASLDFQVVEDTPAKLAERVVDLNLNRRHLSVAQRAALAVELSTSGTKSLKEAAALMNVSYRSAKSAAKGERDNPGTLDKMKGGQTSAGAASGASTGGKHGGKRTARPGGNAKGKVAPDKLDTPPAGIKPKEGSREERVKACREGAIQLIGTLRELGSASSISHIAMAAIQSAKLEGFKDAESYLEQWIVEANRVLGHVQIARKKREQSKPNGAAKPEQASA